MPVTKKKQIGTSKPITARHTLLWSCCGVYVKIIINYQIFNSNVQTDEYNIACIIENDVLNVYYLKVYN